LEKSKEFWFYEGSEAVEPFRETVNLNQNFINFSDFFSKGSMVNLPFCNINIFKSTRKTSRIT